MLCYTRSHNIAQYSVSDNRQYGWLVSIRPNELMDISKDGMSGIHDTCRQRQTQPGLSVRRRL